MADIQNLRDPNATALSGSLGFKSPPYRLEKGQWQINLHCGAGKGLSHIEDLAAGTDLMVRDANKQVYYSSLDKGREPEAGAGGTGRWFTVRCVVFADPTGCGITDGCLSGGPTPEPRFHLRFISAIGEIQTVKLIRSAENSKPR